MARLPIASGGQPVRRSGGLPSEQGGKAVDYVDAQKVGFGHVPEEIVRLLVVEEVLAGTEVAATAEAPVAKRRTDRSHYQLITAWWASTSRYVTIDARRELIPDRNGKFRPAGEWLATGKAFRFPDGLQATTSVWRLPSGAGTASSPRVQYTDDPLDLLPPAVTKPMAGSTADAWRVSDRHWATETVVASRLLTRRFIALNATRQARSQRKLEGAEWVIKTIDAPIVDSWEFSAGRQERSALLRSIRRSGQHPPDLPGLSR
ncbi:MAG: hypothetical protein ACYDGY_07835 [Acidimicrobiales bacterium]